MKFLIAILFLALFTASVRTQEGPPPSNCPKVCDCPNTKAPVCSDKGKTYGNKCLAKCFGATKFKNGRCPEVCDGRKPQIIKKHSYCKWVKYGKCSRKKCCAFLRYCVNGKCRNSQEKCAWASSKRCVRPKTKCTMVVLPNCHGKKKREKCCSWTETCNGKYCNNSKKKCSWVGHVIVKKFHHGCRWKVVEGTKKRKYCCKVFKECKGKKCKVLNRNCQFTGPTVKITEKQVCRWRKKNDYAKQRYCCLVKTTCHDDLCKTKKSQCRYVGKVVTRIYKNHCSYRKYKTKNCRRIKCCKWVKHCNGNTCKILNKKCQWQGCARCTTTHSKCKVTRRCKKSVQNRCCTSKRTCICKHCVTHHKKCVWTGPRIVTTYHNKCRWKMVGKNTKRKYCCKHVKTCHGKNHCKKHGQKCKFVGEKITTTVKKVCTNVVTGNYATRKKCCFRTVVCFNGVNCHIKKKQTCVWSSVTVIKKPNKLCKWKKYKKKGSFRRYCCSWTNYCHTCKKRGKRCRKINQVCKWKGSVVTVKRMCKCEWRNRTKHKCRQRKCCCWKRRCVKGKCYDHSKKCKWSGYKIKTHVHKKCKWNAYGKYGRRVQCCTHTKVCKGKSCRKSKNCKWIGVVIVRKVFTKCSVAKKGKYCKIRQCCEYLRHCYGKKCNVYKRGCSKAGHKKCHYPKRHCSYVKVGKFKKQKKCCVWVKSCNNCKCKITKKRCKLVGKVIHKERKCTCGWSVRPHGGKSCKQRKCCCFTKKCTGWNCGKYDEKCRWVGYRITYHWKHKCEWRPHGANGRRRFCCKSLKTCYDGKNCKHNKKGYNCKWVGKVVTRIVKKNCKMYPYQHGKRKRCCTYVKRCFGNKCDTKLVGCAWKNLIVTVRKVRRCETRVYRHKQCRRSRCCHWTRKCINGVCRNLKKKCGWTGQPLCISKHCTCRFTTKHKNCQQRQCCCHTRRCRGKKCINHNKKCRWVGHRITTHTKTGCIYKKYGKNGRRKQCCTVTKRCHSKTKKCKMVRRNCKWTGCAYYTRVFSRCQFKKLTHNKKRRHCCNYKKHCCGKKCTTKRLNCSWRGKTFYFGCVWKKQRICVKPKQRRGGLVCAVQQNPQIRSFTGKVYNCGQKGQVCLVKSKGFSVFAERSRFSNKYVVKSLIVDLGKTVVTSNSKVGTFTVVCSKTRTVTVKVGQTYKFAGGYIKRVSKNRCFVYSSNGQYVDLRYVSVKKDNMMNLVIKVKELKGVRGLCVNQNQAKIARK